MKNFSLKKKIFRSKESTRFYCSYQQIWDFSQSCFLLWPRKLVSHLFICLVCVHVPMVHMWRSKYSFQNWFCLSNHMGPRNTLRWAPSALTHWAFLLAQVDSLQKSCKLVKWTSYSHHCVSSRTLSSLPFLLCLTTSLFFFFAMVFPRKSQLSSVNILLCISR